MVIMNDEFWRMWKRSWPIFWNYTGICLKGLSKITKNLIQYSLSPGRDLNPGPPENEARLLNIRPRHSVIMEWTNKYLCSDASQLHSQFIITDNQIERPYSLALQIYQFISKSSSSSSELNKRICLFFREERKVKFDDWKFRLFIC
jgi:hypothetical protein